MTTWHQPLKTFPPETLGDQGKSLGDQGRLDGRVELIAGDDEWVVQGDYLIRVHKFPRMCLFTPLEAEDPPPVPIDKIDVMRTTRTDIENIDEQVIEDCWDGKSDTDHRPLSAAWIGETQFEIIRD